MTSNILFSAYCKLILAGENKVCAARTCFSKEISIFFIELGLKNKLWIEIF
jgi:hypothetical protein